MSSYSWPQPTKHTAPQLDPHKALGSATQQIPAQLFKELVQPKSTFCRYVLTLKLYNLKGNSEELYWLLLSLQLVPIAIKAFMP